MGGQAAIPVRRATAADIESLFALQEQAFGTDPVSLTRARFAAFIAGRGAEVLVAGNDGDVTGYVVMQKRPFRPWASLDFISVAENHRRAGVGTQLIGALLPLVRRRSLRLFVRTDNHAAIAFYGRNGFEVAGLRDSHFADECDALAMIRRL